MKEILNDNVLAGDLSSQRKDKKNTNGKKPKKELKNKVILPKKKET